MNKGALYGTLAKLEGDAREASDRRHKCRDRRRRKYHLRGKRKLVARAKRVERLIDDAINRADWSGRWAL